MTSFDEFRTQILDSRPSGAGPDNLVLLETIDSTNRVAARMVRDFLEETMTPPAFLVLALEQTGGKGRQGRSWESPRGAGLYATRVVSEADLGGDTDALSALPLLVAVGLARGLRELLGEAGEETESGRQVRERCAIKWPNDLLVDGRKIGGVLIEALSRGGGRPLALVGCGVNLAAGNGTLPGAVSLEEALETGSGAPDPPELGPAVWTLIGAVEAELEHLGDVGYAVSAYRALSAHRERDAVACTMGGERIEGIFRGFDPRGFLRLEVEGEIRSIAAGEVTER